MKNIVMGTAGHIDHGKTTIVKYLTGKDTDTLPDEKKRGITIDLGFSYIEISPQKKIGIIDVPGHEKFIKNMTAGAVGVDYLILTVACDDGIMPQTEEHFHIAELLGVKTGVIVLTKTDLADEKRIFEVKNQIRDFVKNSFLENAEIIETSIKNISSYEKLKNYIINHIKNINIFEKENEEFRMAVDRCFSVKGFGTVVTGTSLSGKISVGDFVNIYPLNIKAKIKGIESHGDKLDSISAGNRTALNLAGIEKNMIKRGYIISSAGNFQQSNRIDVMFTVLKNMKLKNNFRGKIYLGTREIVGRVKFFGQDIIEEEGRYPAQIFLEENISAVYGELGIVRNFSPVYIIGGIKILNLFGKKVKRDDKEYIDNLMLLDEKGYIQKENDILNSENLEKILEKFHNENHFQRGILRAELKNRYFNDIDIKEFRNFIEKNIEENIIKSEKIFEKEYISLKDFKIKLTKEQKKLKDDIFKKYKEYMFSPENYETVKKYFNNKYFDEIHNYMAEEKMIISLGDNFFILRGFLKEAETKIREFFYENDKITVSKFRELLKINRKYALLILEKLDNMKVTERISDYRILKK